MGISVAALRDMFPTIADHDIANALSRSAGDLECATNALLELSLQHDREAAAAAGQVTGPGAAGTKPGGTGTEARSVSGRDASESEPHMTKSTSSLPSPVSPPEEEEQCSASVVGVPYATTAHPKPTSDVADTYPATATAPGDVEAAERPKVPGCSSESEDEHFEDAEGDESDGSKYGSWVDVETMSDP